MNPRQGRPSPGPTHPLHSHCIIRVPTPVFPGCPRQGGGGLGVAEPIQNVDSAGKPPDPPQPVATLRLCP